MNLKELFVFGSPKATCKNCRKAEAIIEEIITGHEELFDYRKLTLDSQEANELGVCVPLLLHSTVKLLFLENYQIGRPWNMCSYRPKNGVLEQEL